MRFLIAIVTCEARRAWADAQRNTWARDCRHDVRFFLARQDREALPDEIFLECGDGYASLQEKVREVSRWAVRGAYQLMLKVDDDVVVFPTRFIFPQGHYTGWKQDPCQGPYCAGLAYWLSRDAMQVMSEATLEKTSVNAPAPEDRWTGKTLYAAGIQPEQAPPRTIQWVGRQRPLPQNVHALLSSCYAAGEFQPHEFKTAYRY